MKVNVLTTILSADELYFTDKTTVVIDVLRATTTIVTALKNGAREVLPVATVEFAMKVSGGSFSGQTLLCGERNTRKIEGFALGNSPLEFTEDKVSGKTVILYTTNGTRAIVKAKFSSDLYVCSFSNVTALARHLYGLNKDIEIFCAGRNNNFSLEDTICAGKLISELEKVKDNVLLTDSARASVSLSKSLGKSILKMLKESEHGKILLENGFEEDLMFCSKLNTTQAIPYFTDNALKLLPDMNEDNDD